MRALRTREGQIGLLIAAALAVPAAQARAQELESPARQRAAHRLERQEGQEVR
jgi:hypothetical protein